MIVSFGHFLVSVKSQRAAAFFGQSSGGSSAVESHLIESIRNTSMNQDLGAGLVS